MSTERSAVLTWSRLEVLASPRARQVIGVVSFAVLTALGAKIALPIAGTSVPFTFQPLAVLLAGAMLGARRGAASQILYLAAGLAGFPVFSGFLFSVTGGYLIAYPVAAFVVGSLTSTSTLRNLGALLAGLAVIYAGGVAWLAILTGWSTAVVLGILPFVGADLVKVLMALVITNRIGRRSRALFGG
ncbi:MAG: biotin transporter BioY [Gemmatimonadota bacterium]